MIRFFSVLLVGALVIVGGCASLNDQLTPSATRKVNNFDGSIEVIQPPVSAASSMSEEPITLGMMWKETYPEQVLLSVGVSGIEAVTNVEFNVDGQIMKSAVKSGLTDVNLGHTATLNLPNRSTGYFVIPLDDLKRISLGNVVKVRVTLRNSYVVSSFGKEVPATIVSKFPTFFKEISKR
ncbi:hypothetical protein [Shewanella xiamenensis]|uniref:hypothetical protein n=1 Tax=Shewanella xiamenensis TaxID=332186 RepID=UPI00313B8790